jgi:hypothetical protein
MERLVHNPECSAALQENQDSLYQAIVGWAPPTDLKPLVQVNSAVGGAHLRSLNGLGMSNQTLTDRLGQLVEDFQAGNIDLGELARQVEFHAGCFEGLEFFLFKRLRSLAQDLQVQAWYAEEGCPDDAERNRLISDLRAALDAVPKP